MRAFLILACILTGPLASFADTLDYYQVYFHGKQIGNFTEGKVIRIVLKADSIRINDSIHVDVFRDAPCGSGCTYSMLIFGSKGPIYVDTTQQSQDFSIPLRPLMQHKFQTGTTEFTGYYTEFPVSGTRNRVISFKVILQGL